MAAAAAEKAEKAHTEQFGAPHPLLCPACFAPSALPRLPLPPPFEGIAPTLTLTLTLTPTLTLTLTLTL